MTVTPRRIRFAASRRGVVLGLAAGALAGCIRVGGPLHEEQIADLPYTPVDPARAAAAINAYRAQNGAGALTLDPDLQRIAADYAGHLAEAGRMTHDLEPFGGLERRMKAAGYPYASAGENLGQGYRNLEQVIDGWKHSPAHDRGMKDPEMTRMGIASAANPRKRGDVYWCLIVAKPRAAGAAAGTGPFAPHAAAAKTTTWGALPIPFFGSR